MIPDGFRAFSPANRESFLAAIARHRRASWRVTIACAVGVAVLTLVVAVLMAPLLYSIVGLGFDVANLFTPAPDVMGLFARLIDPLVDSPNPSLAMFVRVGVLLPLPGLALMAVATYALRHAWLTSPLFTGGDVPGRPLDRSILGEEQLGNVVEEMAIAAGIPAPRIVVVAGGVNAAALGVDQAHATILVGEALPASLQREQLEGLMAHLVGSIADGDMRIGLRVTTTLALFGLVARVGTAFNDRQTFRDTAKLWRVFVTPTSANTAALLGVLADPFRTPSAPAARPGGESSNLTWREWLLMPLMGPVLLTGFLSGFATAFLLEPLVAWAWRQRKYMADATAVELTRDPDALAEALAAVEGSSRTIAPWTAHLAVAAGSRGADGPFGQSIVPIFPSVERRVAALARMGAHIAPVAKPRMPWPLVVVLAILVLILATLFGVVLYLLVILSAALSGLFTLVPAALLHALLRALGR